MRRLVICCHLLLAFPLFAQVQLLSPEQMVEQLKTAPRTRGLRNLKLELVAAGQAQGAQANGTPAVAQELQAEPQRPSLSLSIQFDFNSARIRPESEMALSNLATALGSSALLPSRFVVEGHTDAKGTVEYNRRLSDQRALAVKDMLIARGIDFARLLSVGKGASEPANIAAPMAPENRRVKIVNLD